MKLVFLSIISGDIPEVYHRTTLGPGIHFPLVHFTEAFRPVFLSFATISSHTFFCPPPSQIYTVIHSSV